MFMHAHTAATANEMLSAVLSKDEILSALQVVNENIVCRLTPMTCVQQTHRLISLSMHVFGKE